MAHRSWLFLRNDLNRSCCNETLWPVADLLGTLHGISCIANVVLLESHHGLHFHQRGVDKSMVHTLIHSAEETQSHSMSERCVKRGFVSEESYCMICILLSAGNYKEPIENVWANRRQSWSFLSSLPFQLVLCSVFILQDRLSVRCWISQTLGVSFSKHLISWRTEA